MTRDATATELLVENWGAVLMRGIAAILFGLFTLWMPKVSLGLLVLTFGIYALVTGVLAMAAAMRSERSHQEPRWPYAVLGFWSIAAGLVALFWPSITGMALLWIVAIWAIASGISEIISAIRLRKEIEGEWWMLLAGLASAALGVVLIVAPLAGALAIAVWIGVYALLYGVLVVALGFRLRSWAKHPGAYARDYAVESRPAQSRP